MASLYAQGLVLACGPLPFLRVVQQYGKRNFPYVRSFRWKTAWPAVVGACLGCVSKKQRGLAGAGLHARARVLGGCQSYCTEEARSHERRIFPYLLPGLKLKNPVIPASGTFGLRPGIHSLRRPHANWAAIVVKGAFDQTPRRQSHAPCGGNALAACSTPSASRTSAPRPLSAR